MPLNLQNQLYREELGFIKCRATMAEENGKSISIWNSNRQPLKLYSTMTKKKVVSNQKLRIKLGCMCVALLLTISVISAMLELTFPSMFFNGFGSGMAAICVSQVLTSWK